MDGGVVVAVPLHAMCQQGAFGKMDWDEIAYFCQDEESSTTHKAEEYGEVTYACL